MLLTKLQDVEGRLNNHVNQLTKTMDELRSGLADIRIPVIDTDAVHLLVFSIQNQFSFERTWRQLQPIATSCPWKDCFDWKNGSPECVTVKKLIV